MVGNRFATTQLGNLTSFCNFNYYVLKILFENFIQKRSCVVFFETARYVKRIKICIDPPRAEFFYHTPSYSYPHVFILTKINKFSMFCSLKKTKKTRPWYFFLQKLRKHELDFSSVRKVKAFNKYGFHFEKWKKEKSEKIWINPHGAEFFVFIFPLWYLKN